MILRPSFFQSSDSPATIFLVCNSEISAAALRGLHCFSFTFSFQWLVFLDLIVGFSISQQFKWIHVQNWSFYVKSEIDAHSSIPRMNLSLPLSKSPTITILHFTLFFSSSLIKTAPSTSIFVMHYIAPFAKGSQILFFHLTEKTTYPT